MPPKPTPASRDGADIPLFYRLFFTWIEPLAALSGSYLYFFQQPYLLARITPPALHAQTRAQSPIEAMLLWNVGSLYILFFAIEFCFLRYARSRGAWRLVMAGILFGSDWGHLWGCKILADAAGEPAWWWWPGAWARWEDWGNLGTLWFGAGMRAAFLLGVGF
ncbi:hypothetical protein GTA08_BOTSDO12879 [Botryosphaeria dothidea]|uniref:DUF7704 domain-containing protein n=1 Tax=Botryosphaeria dothidea TaxID=55169 RepID=A0A8H4J1U9_9PEZI|nr:hypothetical protein GTA08_BOTSDO12879 [Botryosphaeria dothidea]